jgi:probable DNA repair protein
MASWAAEAWSLGRHHGIDLAGAVGTTRELRALQSWSAAYERLLQEKGWLDPAQIAQALHDTAPLTAPQTVSLLDIEPTPAETAGLGCLEEAGWRIERVSLPRVTAKTSGYGAPNGESELEAAVDWARARIAADSQARIALVVPPTYATGTALEREFDQSSADVGFARGRSAARAPAVAAALAAIELFTPQGGVRSLSRWLRSPFFHGHASATAAAAARIDAELRGSLYGNLDFRTAFQNAGLAEFIRHHDTSLAAVLSAASDVIPEREVRLSPTRWTELWRTCLRTLGWLPASAIERDVALQLLDAAFSELSRLTPIVGTLTQQAAFDELQAIAQAPVSGPRMPLSGIHVLEHVDEVGPGFDAVWALGISDGAWPEKHAPNPLLPRRLQIEHELPYAHPGDAVRRARRSLERLRACAAHVIVSWPLREEDAPRRASALIEDWPLTTLQRDALRGRAAASSPARLTSLVDRPAPSPTSRLRGGAAMLNAQASCPLRAFIDFRLDARPLERWGRGVSPRLRGIMLHRAADRLLPAGTTRAALRDAVRDEAGLRITDIAESTLREHFGGAASALLHLFALERRRFIRVLQQTIEAESRRGDFTILDVEKSARIRIGDWVIHARLDRLDRLADGRLAIVDYKTGRQIQAPKWFGATLGDLQLPLYTLAVSEPVAAAVLCHLSPEEVRYRGYWEDAESFPDRTEKLDDGRSWREQLDHWAALIRVLVAEFANGDTRIRVAESEQLEGQYAAVSRIHEQLLLHKGSRA